MDIINKSHYKLNRNGLLFLCSYCALFIYLYKFPDSLDIIRYYEQITLAASQYNNILSFIVDTHQYNIDFIYFAVLFIFKKVGINLNFATWLFVTGFYIAGWKICQVSNKINIRWNSVVPFVLLFCVPIDWIISISRTLASLMFAYFSLLCYLQAKYHRAIVFIVCALFTHFMSIMFIAIYVGAIFLQRVKLSNTWILIILVFIIVLGLFPEILSNSVSLLFATVGGESRYGEYYAEFMEVLDPIMKASRVDYGSKAVALCTYITSIWLCIIDRNRNITYWLLFLSTLVLSFFFHSSIMMVNRTMMFMPAFIMSSVYSVFNTYTNGAIQYRITKFICYLYLLLFVVVLYAARNVFF